MRSLAQIVHEYILKHALLKAGDRVGVAVSGGADSVALLRLLIDLRREIGIVLSVVHFNHKLRREESEEDQRFVGELALTHKLEFRCESGNVKARAAAKHLSLETAARAMRYEYFRGLMREGVVNRIATGHTLDDQAETVLLRLVRGAGTRGLAGIYPKLAVAQDRNQGSGVKSQEGRSSDGACGAGVRRRACAIVRPLLGVRRRELETYLDEINQAWREDSSNRDLRHARNRVRHGILPRMERHLNPSAREALAETAEIARAEEEFWHRETSKLLPDFWEPAAGRTSRDVNRVAVNAGGRLKPRELTTLPLALQRRIVRAVAASLGLQLEFRRVEAILALANRTNGAVGLSGGWRARGDKNGVHFEVARSADEPADYEYCLPVPGWIDVPEIGSRFEAVIVDHSTVGDDDPAQWLDAVGIGDKLQVRNWRAGDRFWPTHTRAPKKIKELLAEKHVTGRERKLWPVIVHDTKLIWVRGFPTRQSLQPEKDAPRILSLREKPLKSKRKSR